MARGAVNRTTRLAAAAVISLSAKTGLAHPLCYLDDSNPSLDISATYCSNEEPDGFCCSADVESELQSTLEASGASGDCAELYKEVLCGVCHPYSAHLYERLDVADGLTMTIQYCEGFFSACSEQLELGDDYCEVHTGGGETDQYWSYPLIIDDSFDDSSLIKAFPSLADESLPTQPIDMRMTPDGSKWWIAGLEGEIFEVDAVDGGVATEVLNIADKIVLSYEEGCLAFAFDPSFHVSGMFYVSYTTAGDEFAANRLSRFVYDATSAEATSASEEVLVTTSEKQSSVHSAGWIGFPPSSYSGDSTGTHNLYWAVGDGGPQNDLFNRAQDTNEYHGSMMRISVSSDAGSGYTVPDDNPFSGGGGLEEICAWGMRNPYRCSFDKDTDDLYCGDVGHLSIESINKIECGNNYGWRRFEGERCSDQVEAEFDETCEDVDRSDYSFPIYNYCHADYLPEDEESYLVDQDVCGDRSVGGTAVVGGIFYRGAKFSDLFGGNYVFADFTIPALYHLYPNGDGTWGHGTILQDDTVPEIASFGEDNEGEMYFIGYQGTIYEMTCGSLCDGSDATPVTLEPVVSPTAATPAPSVETPEPTALRTESPLGENLTTAPAMTDTLAPAATMSPSTAVDTPTEGGTPTDDSAPTEDGDRVPDLCIPVEDGEVPMQDVTPEVSPEQLGCYQDSTDDSSARILQLAYQSSDSMTPLVCETFCRESGADLFGLEYGSECLCGSSRDTDLDQEGDASCDMPCSGDPSAICGGYLAVDVYNIGGGSSVPVGSEYLGCMKDDNSSFDARALFEGMLKCDDTMTTQMCERFCRDKGAVVYGLQFGHECFCGEELDHDQYGVGVCNLRCIGDPRSTCGGDLAQNVYALNY